MSNLVLTTRVNSTIPKQRKTEMEVVECKRLKRELTQIRLTGTLYSNLTRTRIQKFANDYFIDVTAAILRLLQAPSSNTRIVATLFYHHTVITPVTIMSLMSLLTTCAFVLASAPFVEMNLHSHLTVFHVGHFSGFDLSVKYHGQIHSNETWNQILQLLHNLPNA